MKKIGLTGGIATGKSTVTWMFQDMGAAVINADEIAHALMQPKSAVWKALFERYGDHIMQKGKHIDRAALAAIIFGDQDERQFVEHVIHPRVYEEITKSVAELEKKGRPYVIIEVPLLFETGWESHVDAVVVVRCDHEQQVVRCMQKFKLIRAEAEHRIGIQRPLSEKEVKADFIIDTAGSETETLVQAQRLFRQFEKGIFTA